MERPPFPRLIDSTSRKSFVSCPTQWFYGHVLHLRPAKPNINLHFGGCFASGLEATRKAFYDDGLSVPEAKARGYEAIIKSWGDFEFVENRNAKALDTCLLALDSYFTQYDPETDPVRPIKGANGQAAVEFSFSLPIPGVTHPDGGPVLYAGRCDMIGEYMGATYPVDEKTTTALGHKWLSNYRLSSQITGYIWASSEYGFSPAAAIIRGLGILKSEIQHLQVIEYRPKWMIERWLEQLSSNVNSMIRQWSEMKFDHALDDACSSYSGCPFSELCLSEHPEDWFANYLVYVWNPLNKTGETA